MNLRNPKEYCESLLVIRNKKQELVPLRFNEAQSNLYAVIRQQAALGKPIRIIILKGRQEGISTVTEALFTRVNTARMVNFSFLFYVNWERPRWRGRIATGAKRPGDDRFFYKGRGGNGPSGTPAPTEVTGSAVDGSCGSPHR